MPSLFGSDRGIKSVSDWYKDYSNSGSWNQQAGEEPPAQETESTSPPVTAAPAPAPSDNTQSAPDSSSSSRNAVDAIMDPQQFKNDWSPSSSASSGEHQIDAGEFRGKWGVDAQDFKDKWVSGMTNSGNSGSSDPAQASNNNAAAITAQDMTPTQEQGFDTAKWGYQAGSNPYTKNTSHDDDVLKRSAGLDYSAQQDRNYWAAKADKVRGETFGDVWKMEAPTWNRWEDPEEIKTTWQDRDDDD